MKHVSLVLFLLVYYFTVSAQTGNSTTPISIETVAKKWEFSDLINPNFSKKEYEETKEMLASTIIDLRVDKTFTFSFMTDLVGTWTLTENIITTTDRRGKNTWIIHKISPNEIIMSRNDAAQKIIFTTK